MKSFKVGDKKVGKDMNPIAKKVVLFLVTLSVLFVEVSAFAKPPKVAPSPGKREEGDFVIEKRGDGSTVKYKKKTAYDFEGANIDGIYNKPSGSYISNIKDVKAKSIIRIRENFDAEVVDSERLLK